MGLLVCPRCNAKTIADSIEEGRNRLDHAMGLYLGKPCEDGKCELIFTGPEVESGDEVEAEVKSKKTNKKIIKSTLD